MCSSFAVQANVDPRVELEQVSSQLQGQVQDAHQRDVLLQVVKEAMEVAE